MRDIRSAQRSTLRRGISVNNNPCPILEEEEISARAEADYRPLAEPKTTRSLPFRAPVLNPFFQARRGRCECERSSPIRTAAS